MKKNLISTIIAIVTIATISTSCVSVGEFGKVSFATDQTWTVGNQIWSDAVQATECNKVTFVGRVGDQYVADCRSNPNHKGDLFSWVAVATFGEELCPKPWRVPTKQDFIDLDIALGGEGIYVMHAFFRNVPDKYISNWGAVFGGFCESNGSLDSQGDRGIYWSQSETGGYAYSLCVAKNFFAYPHSLEEKSKGFTLRCVKNN